MVRHIWGRDKNTNFYAIHTFRTKGEIKDISNIYIWCKVKIIKLINDEYVSLEYHVIILLAIIRIFILILIHLCAVGSECT